MPKSKKIRHGSYGGKGGGSSEYLKALEEAAKDPDENDEVEAVFDFDEEPEKESYVD